MQVSTGSSSLTYLTADYKFNTDTFPPTHQSLLFNFQIDSRFRPMYSVLDSISLNIMAKKRPYNLFFILMLPYKYCKFMLALPVNRTSEEYNAGWYLFKCGIPVLCLGPETSHGQQEIRT